MTRAVLIFLVVGVFALYSCEAKQRCPGGPYDVITECGSNCEPSCKEPQSGACIASCAVNVCRCQNGFYRREGDQRCVRLNQCRSRP